jgi:hypothetical protein
MDKAATLFRAMIMMFLSNKQAVQTVIQVQMIPHQQVLTFQKRHPPIAMIFNALNAFNLP